MLLEVLTGNLTFKTLRPVNLTDCTKREIKDYFENSYHLLESLFVGLRDESLLYHKPDRLRLPLIFYYGHTASVYINKMILADMIQPSDRINLKFDTMFETGVDEMSWDDTDNYRMGGEFLWPTVKEVVDFRSKVKQLVLKAIDDTPLELPITRESIWWTIVLAISHERGHIETTSVLLRELPIDMVQLPVGWNYAPPTSGRAVEDNPMITVEEDEVCVGKPFDFPSYGDDMEYGKWQCKVPAFQASKFHVTNREFLSFVEDGCYRKSEFWTTEGWEWNQFKQPKHPSFWVCTEGCKSGCGGNLMTYSHCIPPKHSTNGHSTQQKYRLRCVYSEIDLPLDWPAEVNYHEAKAFCAWKGPKYRLLAEAEIHAIREKTVTSGDKQVEDTVWKTDSEVNLNLLFGSPTPVNFFPPNTKGFCDTYGNVWSWTEDHFNELPGFKSHHLYDDYSTPGCDGRHNVLKGGCWMSNGTFSSKFFRNYFRRHFFQHAGFRLACCIKDDELEKEVPIKLISSKIYVAGIGYQTNPTHLPEGLKPIYMKSNNTQYDHDHTDRQDASMIENCMVSKDFNLTEHCKDLLDEYKIERKRALHAGCGNGKFTMELKNIFKEVIGQDYCGYCIDKCQEMHAGEDGITSKDITKDESEQSDSRISFKQFTWLPNEIGFHDFMIMTFLDRAMNPKAWLVRCREILKKEGLLMVVSFGKWGGKSLKEEIGKSFDMVSNKEIDRKNETPLLITGWQHKSIAK